MSEREANGQFGKGNRVAAGNKGGGRSARPKEEQYLDIMLRTCTAEDWEKIVKSAVTFAKAGDGKAREWLSNYILGKPIERTEISGPNGSKLELNLTWGDYATDDGASPELA